MSPQNCDSARVEVDGPAPTVALWPLLEDESMTGSGELPPDRQVAHLEVDVLPPEPAHLAAPLVAGRKWLGSAAAMSPAELVRTVRTVQTVKERTRENLLVVIYVLVFVAVTVLSAMVTE